jgi:uncharacterized protein with PQ loop repeat
MSMRVKTIGCFLFLLFSILIEILTMHLLGYGFAPAHLAFDIAYLLMIGAVVLAIPSNVAQFILETVFLVLQVAIAATNLNLQAITGETFMWEMLSLIGAAREALEGTSMLNFNCLYFLLPPLLGFLILRIYTWKKMKRPRIPAGESRRKTRLRAFVATFVVAVSCFGVGFLMKTLAYAEIESEIQGATEEEILLSDAYLFETMLQGDAAIETFGNFSYYVKCTLQYIGLEGDVETSASLIDAYLAEGGSSANAYTGISAGNNLIVILLESFEYFAIDEEVTPTLYRLFYEDGVLLDNYHSKNKTDVSEAYALFGSYPGRGSLSYLYLDNSFPYDLPNMIRDHTEITEIRSFHNNVGSFYNRSIAHRAFGFDEHVDASSMNLTDDGFWVKSDKEMMADKVEEMIPEEGGFFTYITSFVTHGGYYDRPLFEDTYADFDEIGYMTGDSGWDDIVRNYMAAAVDLDQALEILFDRLEETDHLDDTTVVLFSDHQAYYYGLCYYMKGIDGTVTADPELYHLPAVIYDTKLKEYRSSLGLDDVTKFVYTYDLAPTILNLLGIDYNPFAYVGCDIFGDDASVAVSKTGGIFNDLFYTSDGSTVLWQSSDATDADWSAFQSAAAVTMNRIEHLNLVYTIDYWNVRSEEE